MTQLVARITQSFAAIEAEKDQDTLAKKLEQHSALLKELEAKVQAGAKMMEKMEKESATVEAPPAAHQH